MSPSAAASRAVTKAGRLYRSGDWDLLDALGGGKRLEQIAPEQLPEPMRAMSESEREAYVGEQREKRSALKKEIAKLAEARRDFLRDARKKAGQPNASGLDDALKASLRKAAERKGFRFED